MILFQDAANRSQGFLIRSDPIRLPHKDQTDSLGRRRDARRMMSKFSNSFPAYEGVSH